MTSEDERRLEEAAGDEQEVEVHGTQLQINEAVVEDTDEPSGAEPERDRADDDDS